MTKILPKITVIALIAYLSATLSAQTIGSLTFKFTQVPHSPCYSGSRNVLAVWIQTSTGAFVKTKLLDAGANVSNTSDHLPIWAANSGGTSPSSTFTGCNKTDAITGATLTAFGAKTVTWDGKGVNGAVNGTTVIDGTYKITIEECWNHGASKATRTFTFVKGPIPDNQTPATDANFSAITLDWVPLGTGVNEVSVENPEISVYPNPTNGIFNVDFKKADNINVVNMLGSVIFEEKVEQIVSETKTIDLTNFANGIYFIQVLDGEKIARRKIILNK